MIPVKPARKPKDFDKRVREPGLRAIDEMRGKSPPRYPRTRGKPFQKLANRAADIPSHRFPKYWTRALTDLMRAYDQICAYSCFRIHTVTGAASVEHFAAKSKNWKKIYEWSNYRLCCSKMNARKRDFADVLDPFEIKPDWFQLEVLGFQVIPNPKLPVQQQREIQNTIDRLKLNRFRKDRERDAERYRDREISLKVLREESPFVAYELYRQGRLNPGDTW